MKPSRVLVTGASSGIGRAVAEQLLREGREVVLSGRDAQRLADVAALAPQHARVVPFDLAMLGDMQAFADAAWNAFGSLDGVVHAAGVLRRGAIEDVTIDDLRALSEVNAFAPFLLGRALAMKMSRDASMVFVASTLALRVAPETSAYAASKAALVALARGLALEVAERGVRVNVVAPGIVDTPMTRARVAAAKPALDALHPLGGVGNAEDVARATIAVLDMPWTTGAVINVDGGSLLRQ